MHGETSCRHELDKLIISRQLQVSYPTRNWCREKIVHLRPAYLTTKQCKFFLTECCSQLKVAWDWPLLKHTWSINPPPPQIQAFWGRYIWEGATLRFFRPDWKIMLTSPDFKKNHCPCIFYGFCGLPLAGLLNCHSKMKIQKLCWV